MLKNLLNLGLLVVALVGMTACNSSSDPAPQVVVQTGVLVDDPVVNVTFTTATQGGVTNDLGEFQYVDGEMVTFSIGDIILGTVRGAAIITPVQLTGSTSPRDAAALNQLVFLQSLDENGDPDDGITISDAARAAAVGVTLDFTATDFDSQVALVITNITGGANVVVSKEDALANFFETYEALGGAETLGFNFSDPASDCETPEDCGWAMVWEDDFDGTELGADWTPQIGDGCPNLCGWGNQELQYYRAENATVADGMLTIAAQQEAFGGKNYTSSRLITKNAVEVKYGRIETRMQTPDGAGYWPAFWMLPNEEATPYGEFGSVWAAWGEIDIMESGFAGDTDLVAGTLHYGMSFPGNQNTGEEVDGAMASSGFHTYAIEWEEGEIRWYYDGFHYATQTSDVYWNYYWAGEETGYASAPFGPFDQEFYLILNLAVGGTFPGPVGQDTVFPGDVVVDYVRVYECSVDTETGKGCASNLNLDAKQPSDRDVFIGSWDLYTDAVGPLEWIFESGLVTRDLAVTSDGAAVVTEVAAEDTSRGMVVDFAVSAGGGSMQIEAADAESFGLLNVALGGEIKFDVYIDVDNTDLTGSVSVGLGAGLLDVGDLDVDESGWSSVSIRVSDLTNFASLDIPTIFRVEVDSFAQMQFDNIRFVCGAPGGCGIEAPTEIIDVEVLDVYTDNVVTEFWPAGIGAFADDAPDGGGYSDPFAGYHVSWAEVDTGEAGHDTVLEASWGASGAFGLIYIQSDPDVGVDLSAFATGDLVFDMRITDTGDNFTGMTFKVDSVFPSGSADQPVPGVDSSGAWKTYTIPVSSFSATASTGGFGPFDITKVNTGLVIWPNFGNQQNVTIQLDNIRWQTGEPAAPPPPSADPVLPPAGAVVLFEDTEVTPWLLWDCCAGAGLAVVDADDTQRGQVAQIAYSGSNTVVGFAVDGDPDGSGSVALGAEFDGGTLEFDALVVAQGDGPWLLKIESEDTNVNSGDVLLSSSLEGAEPVTGAWQHYTFPLDSGPLAGVDFSTTQVVLVFPTWDSQAGGTIQLDNVHFAPGAGGGGTGGDGGGEPEACPPEGGQLAINGDFEAGDFSCWTQFENAGVQDIVIDPTTGNAARLVLNVTEQATVLKQQRIGAGTVSAGDTINFSFDYRGSSEPGGVLSVKSICEVAGEGNICGDNVATLFPTATWQPFSGTFTLGAGAESYTLEFAAATGAGSSLEFFIDNVSITVAP